MQAWLWIGFVGFVLVMMVLDLYVVGRKDRAVPVKVALAWTGVCVLLALAFTPVLHVIYDRHLWGIGLATASADALGGGMAVTLFIQGWLLEYSLSVDNLFVFALIFSHFRVPSARQHRVLAWGIIAALILRGVMIGAGAVLFQRFHWLLYVAGAFLMYAAIGMVRGEEAHFDAERHWAARLTRKVFPLEPRFHGDRFFVRLGREQGGRVAMTPLFVVLVVINVVDIVFALDSIPAIFGVTTDPFLVFTSNVFAILGLRSLFFALAGLMQQFQYIKFSLVFILAFIGVKMLLSGYYPIADEVALAVILAALLVGVAASLLVSRRGKG